MLVLLEHRYSVAAEIRLELIIRQNFALFRGVLEIISLYVGPHSLDDLGPGQRFRSGDLGKLLRRRDRAEERVLLRFCYSLSPCVGCR